MESKRSGAWAGYSFIVAAVALTSAVGFLSKRTDLSIPRMATFIPGSSRDPFVPHWVKIVTWGTDPGQLPKSISPELRDWTAMWLKLAFSNGHMAAESGNFMVSVQARGGAKIKSRTEWVGDDLYVLIQKGYKAAPERASLVVTSRQSTLSMLAMPKLPKPGALPLPQLGPTWPNVSVKKCERPPLFDRLGHPMVGPDGRPVTYGSDEFSLCVQSTLPKDHILVAQSLGTSTDPEVPDWLSGFVVRDTTIPANESAVFTPSLSNPKTEHTYYVRFTELAPTSTLVHITFPTVGAIRKFGEVWFPRYLTGSCSHPAWQFKLLTVDLTPFRRPPTKRSHIGFILFTRSGLRLGAHEELKDDDLVGHAEVVRVSPSLFEGQWLSIVDGLRAYNRVPAGRYPDAKPDFLSLTGVPSMNLPVTDTRRFPTDSGTLGDKIEIDVRMDLYRIVKTTVESVDLDRPTEPLPAHYYEASMVSGPS